MDSLIGGCGLGRLISGSHADILARTKAALQKASFGVVSEIDLKATFKVKLPSNPEILPYVIIGACQPAIAYKGIQNEPEIGLFMPCTFVVYEKTPGQVMVSARDVPHDMVQNPMVKDLALDVHTKLEAVIRSI